MVNNGEALSQLYMPPPSYDQLSTNVTLLIVRGAANNVQYSTTPVEVRADAIRTASLNGKAIQDGTVVLGKFSSIVKSMKTVFLIVSNQFDRFVQVTAQDGAIAHPIRGLPSHLLQ